MNPAGTRDLPAQQTAPTQGIASIRMDFTGCDESTEAFTANNLTHMLLAVQRFTDMENSKLLDSFTNYQGPVLLAGRMMSRQASFGL